MFLHFPSGSRSLFCSNLSIFLDTYCNGESCCVLLPTINNNFTILEISYRKARLKKATVNTDVHIVVTGTHFNQYHRQSNLLRTGSCLSCVDISYWKRKFGQDILTSFFQYCFFNCYLFIYFFIHFLLVNTGLLEI